MDSQSLRVLEFQHIQSFLQSLVLTGPGRQAVAQVRPSTDKEQIQILLDQVTELKEYLQIGNSLPLGGIHDLVAVIEQVRFSGQALQPVELLDLAETLKATSTLKHLVSRCEPQYGKLADLLDNLKPIPELERKISRAIDNRGQIKDGASNELGRIRKEIGDVRKRLHEELEGILEKQASQKTLQEKLISVRNDRLVIPLRSGAKGALEGIVHATSHSGATCFVEPLSVVPLNNRLSQARSREREEEARILRELTESVLAAAEVIQHNENWLGFIDCVYAKVRLSTLLVARAPQLNDGGSIRLLQATHPILSLQEGAQKASALPPALTEIVLGSEVSESKKSEQTEVVPINLHLDEGLKTLIISGANTGGKTVSLKTLGLLGAMVQAGLHIPVAEGSEWPVLTGIFAEIGDEQDVRAHLSTFSARIQRLVTMLKKVDRRSLVLLDEIGTGTDPAEGAALALALMDQLRKQGPFVVVTTHYHLIKAYGMLHEEVENVSVAFDEKSGRPTYQLVYGHPGTSNALKIAADLGMPLEVLDTARGYLDKDESQVIDLIRELADALERAKTEEEQLRSQRQQLELTQDELAEQQRRLIQSRERILGELREQGENIIKGAEKELQSAIALLQKGGMREAMGIRKRVRDIKNELDSTLESPGKPEDRGVKPDAEGQLVRLRGLGSSGTLVRIKDQGRRAEVQMGPKRVEVDMEALEVMTTEEVEDGRTIKVDGIRIFREVPETCQQRLHLVGLRIEEALPLLDKAIDRAIIDGCSQIHVVHGHGTGRLRKAVQDFLSDHSVVKGFHPEDLNAGGTGVTVVELKD
ncbi:MAG: endonuclease MutS2 [Deltaproteobacteria bacterium]|nr:MAG: endonuclease MutS2 [Deltaproteobacteria bacterium]